jgi:predicted transcriptional regulator
MNLETLLKLKSITKEVDGELVCFKSTDKWMLVLLWYMNRRDVPTSKQNVSRYALLSVTSVGESLKSLEKLGLITKQQMKESAGDYAANIYAFNEDAIMSACEV